MSTSDQLAAAVGAPSAPVAKPKTTGLGRYETPER